MALALVSDFTVVGGVASMNIMLVSVQDDAVAVYRKHGPEDQPEHPGKQHRLRHSSPSPVAKTISY